MSPASDPPPGLGGISEETKQDINETRHGREFLGVDHCCTSKTLMRSPISKETRQDINETRGMDRNGNGLLFISKTFMRSTLQRYP